MNILTIYTNYKIGTHTYLIRTVSFIIIEGCVNHDILTLLYMKYLFMKILFPIISFRYIQDKFSHILENRSF